jgi:PleD family two-component response regulator
LLLDDEAAIDRLRILGAILDELVASVRQQAEEHRRRTYRPSAPTTERPAHHCVTGVPNHAFFDDNLLPEANRARLPSARTPQGGSAGLG